MRSAWVRALPARPVLRPRVRGRHGPPARRRRPRRRPRRARPPEPGPRRCPQPRFARLPTPRHRLSSTRPRGRLIVPQPTAPPTAWIAPRAARPSTRLAPRVWTARAQPAPCGGRPHPRPVGPRRAGRRHRSGARARATSGRRRGSANPSPSMTAARRGHPPRCRSCESDTDAVAAAVPHPGCR